MTKQSTNIKVNSVRLGSTATDLNNFEGTQTIEKVALEPVRPALLGANSATGTFASASDPTRW